MLITPLVVYGVLGSAWALLVLVHYQGWSFGFHPDLLFPFELIGLGSCAISLVVLRGARST